MVLSPAREGGGKGLVWNKPRRGTLSPRLSKALLPELGPSAYYLPHSYEWGYERRPCRGYDLLSIIME
jgi:hypothetical protein